MAWLMVPPGSETRACARRVPQEPGRSFRLRPMNFGGNEPREKDSGLRRARGSRSAAVRARTRGNRPKEPRRAKGGTGSRIVGGTDDGDTELRTRLNKTRTNSKDGERRAGHGLHHARTPRRRRLVTRGISAHAQRRGRGSRQADRGRVREEPGEQPPVAARPREVWRLPGAAGAAGSHPEGIGRGDTPDRHPDLRGQDPATRGRDGARSGIRAGLLGLLVRLPATSLRARCVASLMEHGNADGGRVDPRDRRAKVLGLVFTLRPVC